MSRGGGSRPHLSWLWRAPRRALTAARDLYVRSVTGCAGHLPADAAFGYPTFGGASEYAFSASSSRRSADADVDDDLRELIRAASQRRVAEAAAAATPDTVPRSQSAAAMARIDEDRPCEFGAAAAGAVFLPRSQSCAVGACRVAGRRGRVAALTA